MAKTLLPSSLSAVSSRFSGLPAIFQSFGSFSLMDLGIRRRQLGGGGRDLAVTDGTLARAVRDDAVGYGEFAGRHVPLLGRGLQQHHARRRAATPDIILARCGCRGCRRCPSRPRRACSRDCAPGEMPSVVTLLPVALQFLGHELRKAGERALPHLRARDADHAGIVGFDRDPDVDFGRRSLAPAPRRCRTARSIRAPDRRPRRPRSRR